MIVTSPMDLAKPSLPPELFDLIIAQAQHDLPLLSACSLVCRSWLASSRYHIFRHQVISLRPANVQTFVQLIAHASSTLRPYVYSIELISSDSPAHGTYDSQWLDSSIKILANLPCLTRILIENINWGSLNPATRSTILTGFQTTIQLQLRASEFDSVSQLVQLVCSKPLLQILDCDNLGWMDPSLNNPEIPIPKYVPGTLHTLRLSHCYKRDILDWLASHTPLPPIHHIHFGPIHPEDTRSIGRFLQHLGPNLRTLQLEFWSLDPGGDAEDFCSRVDLSHNSALSTIIMDKFIHFSTYQFSSAVAWIPELVSRVSTLKEMAFGVAIGDVEELFPEDDSIDWKALDDLFCHARFPCLQHLRFWISGPVDFDRTLRAVTRSLPGSRERGLLEFRRGTPRLVE